MSQKLTPKRAHIYPVPSDTYHAIKIVSQLNIHNSVIIW
jgi:hypothetical protein